MISQYQPGRTFTPWAAIQRGVMSHVLVASDFLYICQLPVHCGGARRPQVASHWLACTQPCCRWESGTFELLRACIVPNPFILLLPFIPVPC